MEKVLLEARKRENRSKSANNALRRQGRVPGVIYSRQVKPVPVDVGEGSINPLVFTAKTHLISLNIEGLDPIDCIIKDVQFDPVTDRIVHFDLQAFDAKEKIQIEIPIHLVGSALGVKEGGIVQHSLHKLEIECLPSDIPEEITVDISFLKLGESIHVKDLKLEGVDILNPEESIIVLVTHPKVEKEPVPGDVGAEVAEPEVIGKGKVEENEEE
jgi:large subunit ribosomal protein L25